MAMLLARWTGLDVPTIVVDRPRWLSVKRRTNSMLVMPASLRRPAMPQVSQFRWPTPGSWLRGPARQFLSADAAPRAAPPRLHVPAPAAAAAVLLAPSSR